MLHTCEPLPLQRVTDSLPKHSAKTEGIFRFGRQVHQLDVGVFLSNTHLERGTERAEVKGQRSCQNTRKERGADLGGEDVLMLMLMVLLVLRTGLCMLWPRMTFLIFHCCISSCCLTSF